MQPALDPCRCEAEDHRTYEQRAQGQREAVSCSRRLLERVTDVGERTTPRAKPHRGGGRNGKDRSEDGKATPARVDGDREDNADGEREPRSTTERKEEGCSQHHQPGSCSASRQPAFCVRGEAEREQDSDHGQNPERIRISDRFAQLVAADRVVYAYPVRKQSGRECVGTNPADSGQKPPEKSQSVPPRGEQDQRSCRRDVDNPSLGLQQRQSGTRRPSGGEGDPSSKRRQPNYQRWVETSQPYPVEQNQGAGRREQKAKRKPSPVDWKVAAVDNSGSDDRGEREQPRCGGAWCDTTK
jgi:hypothetical protein